MATETEVRRYVGVEPGEQWPAAAWPGGYTIVYLTDDGELLCAECMDTQPIHFGGDADGWRIEAADVLYEAENDTHCAHCNKLLIEGYEND